MDANSRFARRAAQVLWLAMACATSLHAQLPSYSRVTSPNGRAVLEIRMGTSPANRHTLFTAVITAGPTSGSTSVMLQQGLIQQIFDPSSAAPGWTVVRSSINAFSLGGGCGRSNLIDFPYINGTRPEILRITGTAQQVITLGITNTDQYDSIDCRVSPNGQVLYLLGNRTRQRLELRKEQGGLLQLVRDDFGTVRSTFMGGMRPSLFYRPVRAVAGVGEAANGDDPIEFKMSFFFDLLGGPPPYVSPTAASADDVEPFPTATSCPLASHPDTSSFSNVHESACAGNRCIADLALSGNFEVRAVDFSSTPCVPGSPSTFSSRGGGSLYTFAGVAAVAGGGGIGSANPVGSVSIIDTQTVAVFEGANRVDLVNPFAGRGGPKAGCPLYGYGSRGGLLLAGPGSASHQLQQNAVALPPQEMLFAAGAEEPFEATRPSCFDGLEFDVELTY